MRGHGLNGLSAPPSGQSDPGTLNPLVVGSNPSWLTRGGRQGTFGELRRRARALTIGELEDGFTLALRAEGRTPATMLWYQLRLDRFGSFCHDSPASAVSAETVRAFLVTVKQGRLGRIASDGYVESHRRALSSFFAWAVRESHLARTPLEHVRRYRVDTRELPVLEPTHVQRLIGTQSTATFEGTRNRAMIATLYDTGVRVGEIVRVELEDLDLTGGTMRVHGKGRRDRRVPVSKMLRAQLWTYVVTARPKDAPSPRLFVSAQGGPLLENAVNQFLRRAARVAGITGIRVSPHTFRHSFATAYLRNGGDEFTLQAILGHSTLEMVRRYVHMAAGDVAARHAIASPLERMNHGGH